MTAAKYNFIIEQGSTEIRPFVWRSDDGSAVNLSGCLARMHVRRSYSSSNILMEATTENGLLQIQPLTGRITLVLSAEITAALDWGSGVYDIEIVSADNSVTRLLQGEITISREVTHD